MKTKRDNKIILNLNSCQWARFYYRNQHGDTRDTLPAPAYMSVRGSVIFKTASAYPHPDYPAETMYERAKRLGLLEQWTPEVFFKVTANAGVIFTGDKAMSMWKAWNAKIFKRDQPQQWDAGSTQQ